MTLPSRDGYTQVVREFLQSYSTTVTASASECFAVLTAFEDYPRWSSPITRCRVLERYPDGLPKQVELTLDLTVKTIRYVLEYVYDPPRGARWNLVEGDLRNVEGEYRFEEGQNGTTVTCTQGIDLGFWLPGFIRSGFERKALRDSVEEFRIAVEARRPAGASGRS